MSKEAKNKALLIGLSIAAGLILGVQLDGPFNDDLRGACGSFFAMMARNHIALGLDITGGVPVMNLAPPEPADIVYYRHHPPGAILLVTLAVRVLGESEISARVVPLMAFVVFLATLACLAARNGGLASGLATLLVAAVIPMGAYYAVFVNFEIPTLAAWLLCLAGFTDWRRTGRSRSLALCLSAWVAGGVLDWPLYLGTPLLALLAWRSRQPARRRVAAILFAVPIIVALGVSVWQSIQQGRWGSFPESHGLASYLAEISPLARSVHLSQWALSQVDTLWALSSLAFPCAVLGTCVAWYRRSDATPLLGVLFAVAFLNVFLGAGRSITHDYWSLYFLPWLALGCAQLTEWVAQWRVPRARWIASLLALLIIALGGLESLQVIRRRSAHHLADRGKALAPALMPGETGLTWPWDFQVPYYARHAVLASPHSPHSIESLRAERHTLGLDGAPLVLLALPDDDVASIAGDLAPLLGQTAVRQRGDVRVYAVSR